MLGSNGTVVIAIKPVSPVTVKMDTHNLTKYHKNRSDGSKGETDTRTYAHISLKLGHLCQMLKHMHEVS